MIKKEFIALDKQRATRKMLDFWYRNYSKKYTIKEFIGWCFGKQNEKEYVIVYIEPTFLKKRIKCRL